VLSVSRRQISGQAKVLSNSLTIQTVFLCINETLCLRGLFFRLWRLLTRSWLLPLSLCDSSLQQQSRSLVNICKFDMRYSLSWSPSLQHNDLSLPVRERGLRCLQLVNPQAAVTFPLWATIISVQRVENYSFVSLCIRFWMFWRGRNCLVYRENHYVQIHHSIRLLLTHPNLRMFMHSRDIAWWPILLLELSISGQNSRFLVEEQFVEEM